MKKLIMYQVDAFADRVFGGNPAAVLILEEWLPDETMQAIAGENNLAETAFAKANVDGYDLRWFTPTREVDFCGHATLAAAHILVSEYHVSGDIKFTTRVGSLQVSSLADGLQLDLPSFLPEPVEDIEMPDGLFGTPYLKTFRNFENIYVELEDEAALRSFEPDFTKIAQFGVLGLVVTAIGDQHDFVSRCFFPADGIPEDSVTGSAHSTLVPYWAAKLGKNKLSAYQCSRRGGHLDCTFSGDRVMIKGNAITYMRAVISVE